MRGTETIDGLYLKLTPGERLSPVWIKVRDHLEVMLEIDRTKNERSLSAEDTARLRGRIGCLREILALGVDPPPMLDGGGELATDESAPRRRGGL
jgi:hypothetical protein